MAFRPNSIDVLRRGSRIQDAHKRLDRIADKLPLERSVDLLRGYEGEAAQSYFGVFDHLIRVSSPPCALEGVAGDRRWTL